MFLAFSPSSETKIRGQQSYDERMLMHFVNYCIIEMYLHVKEIVNGGDLICEKSKPVCACVERTDNFEQSDQFYL